MLCGVLCSPLCLYFCPLPHNNDTNPTYIHYLTNTHTQYPALCVAEVEQGGEKDDPKGNEGFRVLAKYIGVFGTPMNTAQQPMAMTSPVIMTETTEAVAAPKVIAMTAPVITTEPGGSGKGRGTMAFVMPFDQKMSTLPTPTDERVTLKEIPAKIVAVRQFSGWYSQALGREQHSTLMKLLVENKLHDTSASDEDTNAAPPFTVSQYHPPFTLGFLRRNEIWHELKETHPVVSTLLQ